MRISEFLKEDGVDGKYSSTRLISLVLTLGVSIIWAIVSLKRSELVDIPVSVVTLAGVGAATKAIAGLRK